MELEAEIVATETEVIHDIIFWVVAHTVIGRDACYILLASFSTSNLETG